MKRKLFNALLFGALVASSTSTFVSCKDYDDDIQSLQAQIDANKKSIESIPWKSVREKTDGRQKTALKKYPRILCNVSKDKSPSIQYYFAKYPCFVFHPISLDTFSLHVLNL